MFLLVKKIGKDFTSKKSLGKGHGILCYTKFTLDEIDIKVIFLKQMFALFL